MYFTSPVSYFYIVLKEINKAVGAVDPTMEECEMAECQSPEGETDVGAAAALEEASALSPTSDAPKEPTSMSSPDTDSPVMINEDVSRY